MVIAGFNVYGEAANIISRLPPSSAIDTVVNEFVTTNLGVASTVLLADVLAAAERYAFLLKASQENGAFMQKSEEGHFSAVSEQNCVLRLFVMEF